MDTAGFVMKVIFLILSFGIIFTILATITATITAGIYYSLSAFFKGTKLKKYSFLIMVIPLVFLLVNRAIRMLTTIEVNNPGIFIFGGSLPYFNSFHFIFDVEIILSTVLLIISMLIFFSFKKGTKN